MLPEDAAALLSGATSVLEIMHLLSLNYESLDLENYASHSADFIIGTFLARFDHSAPDYVQFRARFMEMFLESFFFRLLVTDESWSDLISSPPSPLPAPSSLTPHVSTFHTLVKLPSYLSISGGYVWRNDPDPPPKKMLSYTGTDPIILAFDDRVDIQVMPGFVATRIFAPFFQTFST